MTDIYDPAGPLAALFAEARALLEALADPDPCWFDHNGNCQGHGWFPFDVTEICPNRLAGEFLERHPPAAGSTMPEGGPA